jgi:lysozyme
MQISEKGLALIRQFEGLRLTAYPDPATGAQPWTIGYGHTGNVKPGQVITQEQADAFLRQDCARFAAGVSATAGKCTQGQFDALCSFAYNLGLGPTDEFDPPEAPQGRRLCAGR